MSPEDETVFDHAWRHFALHAEQRMTVFNYFVAMSSLLVGGLAYTLQGPPELRVLGVTAGLLLAGLSFVAWKLDQRASSLVKVAEDVMIAIEHDSFVSSRRVFEAESRLEKNAHPFSIIRPWTYGRSFRRLFLIMGMIGVVGAGISLRTHLEGNPRVEVTASRSSPNDSMVKAPPASRQIAGQRHEMIEDSSGENLLRNQQ